MLKCSYLKIKLSKNKLKNCVHAVNVFIGSNLII